MALAPGRLVLDLLMETEKIQNRKLDRAYSAENNFDCIAPSLIASASGKIPLAALNQPMKLMLGTFTASNKFVRDICKYPRETGRAPLPAGEWNPPQLTFPG